MSDPNMMRDAMLGRMDAALTRLSADDALYFAAQTLDVFLAAYPEQPEGKALLDDDDLLTFGVLRIINRALSATSA